MKTSIEKVLKCKIDLFLKDLKFLNPNALSLIEKLQDFGDVILFGGAVRDIIYKRSLRDIDLVINSDYSISDILRNCSIKSAENIFKGHKVCSGIHKIDIWSMEDTWAFKNNLVKPSFENLSKTTFLNVNAIGYSLKDNQFSNNGFFEFLTTKDEPLLTINLIENPDPLLCTIRAIHLSNELGLSLERKLEYYIEQTIKLSDNKLRDYTSRYVKRYSNQSSLGLIKKYYNRFKNNSLNDLSSDFANQAECQSLVIH